MKPTDAPTRSAALDVAEDARIEAELQRFKWIAVGERLPSIGGEVLLACTYEGEEGPVSQVGIGERSERGWFWGPGVEVTATVTHWAPLPEPPHA